MKFYDHLPQDHQLGRVYRYGAALTGALLLVFGTLGLLDDLAFFSTSGERVLGLSSNGLPHDNPYWRARHLPEADREGVSRPVAALTGTTTRAAR